MREILRWAQRHNEAAEKHFPVLGVGYGMQAMVKSQTADDFYMAEVPQGENLQINLAHAPEHTYLFDEYEERELEALLDSIYLFSDVVHGLSMKEFVQRHKKVSSFFVPVASFNDDARPNSNSETVAVIEGAVYPWFGVGYRVDRIQYNVDDSALEGRLD